MGKVAVVTGAGRGIGLEIAKDFAEQGFQTVLIDYNEDSLDNANRVFSGLHLKTTLVKCDVANPVDVRETMDKIRKEVGDPDILVNNAGISPKHNGKRLETHLVPWNEWEQVLHTNLSSVFLWSSEVIPAMRKKRWGRIINISSQAGRTYGKVAGAHYSASKAGIIGLSRILAGENASYGITVNCIAPGRIDTPMMQVANSQVNEDYKKNIPVGRFGTPHDIAASVRFLASDDAVFITGATLDVNGGTFMA